MISAARTRIARIFALHRIAFSVFSMHHHSHRIAARIPRYGPLRQEPSGNDSTKLVQMNFFYFGWISSGGFPSSQFEPADMPLTNDPWTRNYYESNSLEIFLQF